MGTLQHTACTETAACSSTSSDLQLMRLVLKRNRRAFGILFKRYLTCGITVAQRVGLDYETAQDIVAESFIKIWYQAGAFKPRRGKFSSWFYRIVHNLAVDELRRAHSRARAETRSSQADALHTPRDAPEDQLLQDLDKMVVSAALERLPEPRRQIIRLTFLEGYSHREVAERLALPLGTVHTRVRLGLHEMAQLLQEEQQAAATAETPRRRGTPQGLVLAKAHV
jgi:RNA polymerase sigma-70 factor (ECF subfamily)